MRMIGNWLNERKLERERQEEHRRQEQFALEDIRRQKEERERRKLEALRQHQQSILAMLAEGKLPDWDSMNWRLPFRFMKSEHLIYVLGDVRYLEQRTKREIVGRSVGTSVRVAKGVSVRLGQSRGTPVESDVIEDRGSGLMAVTTKHIYFNGDRSFRINFSKIVSVDEAWLDYPFGRAVSVTRDRASQQPEFFVVGEPHTEFVYELLLAVPDLDLPRGEPEKIAPNDYHMIAFDNADYLLDGME